ncbi:MAG: hypothetical protein J5677_01265 [Bacteroidales bacterium]|nr:hypothetical protein [Bacteroidales bacterium]
MKKITKYFMAVVLTMAMTGFSGCGEKDNGNEEQPVTESTTYAIHHMNRVLEAGQTVYYHPTESQKDNDWAIVEFLLENKSTENQLTYLKVERIDGPSSFDELTICFGTDCHIGTCPWITKENEAITLVPGVNNNIPISVEYVPSNAASSNGVYRITVGKGSSLSDPQVMYLNMAAE